MLDPCLLELLRCPACGSETPLEETETHLICRACERAYPVVDGIPHMLVEEAAPIEQVTAQPTLEREQ